MTPFQQSLSYYLFAGLLYIFYTYQWVTCELRWVGLLLNLFAVQIREVLNNGSVN
jgi:hypothetical protein